MIKLHTNHGVITLKLDEEKAPETAANFKEYVKSGHYDNTVFHRVINNFMIQGGGFEPGMKQKPTRAPIKNEANNGLTNKVGSIAMARTMDPHSASAQFFINVADNDFSTTPPPPPRAGAMPSSAKWSRAWTWSTRSRAWPPPCAAATRTCRPRT